MLLEHYFLSTFDAASACPAPGFKPLLTACALSAALRVLESILAREALFKLPTDLMVATLSAAASVMDPTPGQAHLTYQLAAVPAPGQRGGATPADTAGGAVAKDSGSGRAAMFVACCHVVMAALRHRQQAVRHALPVIGQALRQLLKALVASGASMAPRQVLPRLLPAKSEWDPPHSLWRCALSQPA